MTNPTFSVGHYPICSTLDPINPPIKSSFQKTLANVIKEGDRDISDRKYLNYCQYLLHNRTKYEVFSDIFPAYTCSDIVIYVKRKDSNHARIWFRNNKISLNGLLRHKSHVCLTVVSPGHVSIVWIDSEKKTIDHYDPTGPCDCKTCQHLTPVWIRFWGKNLPAYDYNGVFNFPSELAIQNLRYREKTRKGIKRGDWFCQDYCLLYALYRIRGYNHLQSAQKVVTLLPSILLFIYKLNQILIYQSQGRLIDHLLSNI